MNRFRDLDKKHGVVIDTMVFIYLFEDHRDYAELCELIISRMSEGLFTGVVTPITAAEILVKPLKQEHFEIADRYQDAIKNLPNIILPEINIEIAFMAGSLKAKYGMPLPDMFQAAMALYFPAQALITNDRAMQKIEEIDVVMLDKMFADEI